MQPSWRWYPLRKDEKKGNHSLITVLLPAKSENPFRPRVCGSLSFVYPSIDENSKRTFWEFNTCRHITQNQTEKDSLFLSRPLAPPPPPPPLFSLVSKFSLFKFFNVFTLLPTDQLIATLFAACSHVTFSMSELWDIT